MKDSDTSNLTSKQRAHLRSLAHELKPVTHIGKEGVTVPVIRTVENAFNTRELLKVKVLEMAPADARESAQILAARIDNVQIVQVIGRVIVLYRPDPKKPEIVLPK